MSRIGRKEIIIPDNIEVIINTSQIVVKGKRGQLSYSISELIEIETNNKIIKLKQKKTTQKAQAIHGLSRSIINNMIQGVSKGFEKKLVIQGVGYRSQMEGKSLVLNIGYSHPVKIEPPEDISIRVENNTNIFITGIDKEKVGQIAATIRSVRPPEPYKGKGIRYENETIKRKVGKAGK
uniref:Large ribosomal subunit protein uL6c n=1 Tax=Symphyocladiella dendroidea TaxID=2506487 RepID=A0A1Z1M7Q8_9FLOR|nr:ribosomal protein L6 [Symphyocladiella dendroidea]ARW61923.1 ribosomal protein L6 [Symphyocladiella dendroidea]